MGTPADSSIVNGVVCRKNIAHKRMRRRIENAKILLIGGSVEFNRTQSRLASLESVTKQQVSDNDSLQLRQCGFRDCCAPCTACRLRHHQSRQPARLVTATPVLRGSIEGQH